MLRPRYPSFRAVLRWHGAIRSVAKAAQQTADFFLIARTETLISGLGVDEALRRQLEA